MKKLTLFIALLSFVFVLECDAETIVALTSGNRLLFLDHTTPGTVQKTVAITTVNNEVLVAIDFRPETGNLYALGDRGNLYILNLTTGAASTALPAAVNITGAAYGFDFNPTVDVIRVTTSTARNFRVNANDGTTSSDTNLAYVAGDPKFGVAPNVVGSAYSNNFSGALYTVLYGIDSLQDTLVTQFPANSGALRTVGNLGVDTSNLVGFDISQGTGLAYASLTEGGTAGLYAINLVDGGAVFIGNIATPAILNGESIVGLAVPTATRLLNISTRGRVGAGDDVLIGGFISRGGGRLLLRAIGPSLTAFGVANPLPDPVLTLKNVNGVTLATNDDWQSSQAAEITATGLAPSNSKESVILTSLPAGSYTAVLSGKGSDTGLAIVEVFQLP